MKKTLKNLNLKDKNVLVRVDFNVPLKEGVVTDVTRMQEALPTLNYILAQGGKPVLMSHLGRPKTPQDTQFSLAPVAAKLEEMTGIKVHFSTETVGEKAQSVVKNTPFGEIVLLENTRLLSGETKNDEALSAELAKLGDVFVNDAFGSAHRAHASTEGVTKFIAETALGLLLEKEVSYLGKALDNPESPFIAVIGGAKVSDKIGVIEALLPKVDALLIGGGMTFTFLKSQGIAIGNSLVEDDKLALAADLLARANGKIKLPVDHICADAFSNEANLQYSEVNVPDGFMGLDIGEKSIAIYQELLLNAKTVIWNGPMGVFEMSNFAKGTVAVAQALADATKKGALTIVGGGDSVAAIVQNGFADDVSHVSTGGGAMLEFLEGIELPGVAAIDDI